MKVSLRSNVLALTGHRHLTKAGKQIESSTERLSSGKRINKASDDAAGLSISHKIRANVRSSSAAMRNMNDAISVTQIAEGGLQEINQILVRLRELNIHAASDTVDDSQRKMLSKEYNHLKSEVDRITKSNQFNGVNLLDGKIEKFDVQADIDNKSSSQISFSNKNHVNTTTALGIRGASIDTKFKAKLSIDMVDFALNEVVSARAEWGSLQKRLESSINNIEERITNTTEGKSRIEDADYAYESSKLVRNQILHDSATAVQSTINNSGRNILKLIS